MKTAVGYYFSVDENPFNIADLLTVYSVDEKGEKTDVTDQVTFDYKSPADLYNAQKNAYAKSTLKPKYEDKYIDDTSVTVYVGVKGDTTLNAEVAIDDAYYTLLYYSKIYAGDNNVKFYDIVTPAVPKNDEIEGLMYFLSDIDTEGKIGKNDNEQNIVITNDDALWILRYYSDKYAGGDKTWKEICPTLTKDSPLAK